MITGKTLGLTAITEEDLPMLMEWRNNEDMRQFYREYRELNLHMQTEWYKNIVNSDKNTIMFAIRAIESNELLGCCGLTYINWVNRNAELSLYIGEGNAYIDSRAYEALGLLIKYGFEQIGMKKLWIECYEIDVKRIKMCEDFSFHLDGVLRCNVFHNNKWFSSKIFSLLSEEYKG